MVQVIEDTDTGTYEASQLTLSLQNGDESYLSTSALRISTQVRDGTYEPHQATLRDQSGGVDLNTAEIKTYTSNGSYAAIGSAGTLSLRDSSSNQLDLEPTQIVFDDGTSTGKLSSSEMKISEGSDSVTAWKNSLTITDGSDTSYLKKDSLEILGSGGAEVDLSISSGAGTLVCKDGSSAEGYYSVLMAKIKGDSGDFSQVDTAGFSVSNSGGTQYSSVGLDLIEVNNGSNTTSITSGSVTVGNNEGGFYVGNARLESDVCVVGNDGGFYVGSAKLENSGLDTSYANITGGLDVGGNGNVAGNLDAESISTREITVDGTSYLKSVAVSNDITSTGNISTTGDFRVDGDTTAQDITCADITCNDITVGGESIADIITGRLSDYPTWSEANQTYVDWDSLDSEVRNIVASMTWTATCNDDGTITISAS